MQNTTKDSSATRTKDASHTYDSIIIGSGAGGLATAICLARAGKKVVVLEQHDVPGGWCHSFYLNGHRFTPGVHYVGLMAEGEATNDLYRGLGIANELVFFKMNPDAYEHVRIGEERFDFPANLDLLIKRLSARFPKEKKQIYNYLHLTRKVSEELYSLPYFKGFWQKLTIPFKTKHFGKYGMFSVRRVIGWHIKNPLLRNILNIQCGDHGVQPKKVPFVMHSALMYHYFQGGYYPMGGGGALIKAMTNTLKKHGGELRTSTAVKKIILEGSKRKKAVGVRLENGQELYADTIVSNADVGITYNDLVGRENLSTKFQKKLANTKYSSTSLMLFLIVDMDLRKAGLDSGNIWMMPNKDTDDFYDSMLDSDISKGDAFEGMFISCTTLKDPSSYDGKHHSIEAITLVDFKAFEKFKNEGLERSQAYLDFKELLMQKMINGLEKAIPGISKHIVQKDLGTPLTNKYYVNTTDGNIYGTEKSLKHIGPFAYKAKSEIENLYLCGASILSHGVAGVSHSGVDTAAQILKCDPDELKKPPEDQHIRIYDAEDATDYPEWMLKKIAVKTARTKKKSEGINTQNIY
ncbi:Phytoene dehydrogenase-related protein [Zobellia uliginosa]|uniref:Phytoene dehydrogenase-related protein n=1 Tax=Zobellia uliginosa TaxID=143224 RepID=A0ABY1KRI2_9FLAO|nr:NAD(P)/FAD-dependent oxidoreductase [Zobellia uliginosa]SIS67753.1 Phytoene dehydrogenase-related protein [Zobellia uliginosa]